MEPCILAIDPDIVPSAPPRPYKTSDARVGIRLGSGQRWSEKYPGTIEGRPGYFRTPFTYRGRPANRYSTEVSCNTCGKKYLQDKNNAMNHKTTFCSIACRSKNIKNLSEGNRIAKKRPHGRGSHIMIKKSDHPRGGRHGHVYEHILIMEEKLGRAIGGEERVHHIDMVKNNNAIENLVLCKNNREHHLVHGSINDCVARLLEIGVLYFDRVEMKYKTAE